MSNSGLEITDDMDDAARNAALTRLFEVLVLLKENPSLKGAAPNAESAIANLLRAAIPSFSPDEAIERFFHLAVKLPRVDELHMEKYQYERASQILRAFHTLFGRVPDESEYIELARPEDSPLHSTVEWDDKLAAEKYRAWIEAS